MKALHCLWMANLIVALALIGCGGTTTGKKDIEAKVYDVKGRVTAIDTNKEKPSVKLDHEDIPGLMNAMEMTFKVEDPKLLEGIKVGDHIQGRLEKRDTGNVIVKLEKR